MKKLLSIALALLMVCVMLPVAAMAAGSAASSLPDPVGGTITLESNVELEGMLEINGTGAGAVTASVLDLNGYTISGKGTVLDVYGTLEITDSSANHKGKIVSTAITNPENPNSNAVWVNPGADVTITGGTINAKSWSVVIAGSGADASLTVDGSRVVINNGISGNGSAGGCNTTINIVNGKIKSNDVAIYHPQVGTLNVSGGTIIGATGIEMRSGDLNVTGGTITATASKVEVVANGNGNTTTGAAIAVAQHTTKNEINVFIGGGKLSGAAVINEANPQENSDEDTAKVKIMVNGGKLYGAVNKAGDKSTIEIAGGTFTATRSELKVIKTFIVEDNVILKVESTYTPSESEPAPSTPDDTKNPTTGSNDFVGIAAAAAVMALLGSAVIIRKK